MEATEPAAQGARAVGDLAARDHADRLFIVTLRLWLQGPERQAEAWSGLSGALGAQQARAALRALEGFLEAMAHGARGAIWRHAPCCKRLGRDEALMADAVAAAARGDLGQAAALLAPLTHAQARPALVGTAEQLGRALRAGPPPIRRRLRDGTTLH